MWDAKNDYERDWRRRVLEARGNPRAKYDPSLGVLNYDATNNAY